MASGRDVFVVDENPKLMEAYSAVSPILSDVQRYVDKNNQLSAAAAAEQRSWQEEQNAKAMAFNASEAAANRDWQAYMSNTAHQREVADLKAAGLNPVLSATGGNGASVTSGATASGVTSAGSKAEIDTAFNSVLVAVLSKFLDAQMNLQAMNASALNNMAVSSTVAGINSAATRYASDNSRAASMYSSDSSRYSSVYGTNKDYAARIYNTLANYSSGIYSADSSRAASKYSADSSKSASKYSADKSYEGKANYPSTFAGHINKITDSLARVVQSIFG